MDPSTRDLPPSTDAVEFVRFCYRRRRVGWPDLYDEMCAVANRGLYRGWGKDELGEEGIGFSLFEMPALAALVTRVVAEEHARRIAARAAPAEATVEVGVPVMDATREPVEPAAAPAPAPAPALRFAGATAGA